MISEKLQKAINEQITAEMWSSNLYLAMSFFFEKEGKLYTRDDWFSSGEIRDFFYCAKDDLDNITNVCEAYDAKRPYEFRLIYNVITKALDSKYNYEDIVITGDKNIFDLFEDWFDECGKNITK